MTTISTKQSDIEKKWILIDATDVVVGRLASFIAKRPVSYTHLTLPTKA